LNIQVTWYRDSHVKCTHLSHSRSVLLFSSFSLNLLFSRHLSLLPLYIYIYIYIFIYIYIYTHEHIHKHTHTHLQGGKQQQHHVVLRCSHPHTQRCIFVSTHCYTYTLKNVHIPTCTRTRTRTHARIFSRAYSHTHTISLSFSLSFFLLRSLSLARPHAQTQTYVRYIRITCVCMYAYVCVRMYACVTHCQHQTYSISYIHTKCRVAQTYIYTLSAPHTHIHAHVSHKNTYIYTLSTPHTHVHACMSRKHAYIYTLSTPNIFNIDVISFVSSQVSFMTEFYFRQLVCKRCLSMENLAILATPYGVATINRLLKIIDLFCKRTI